MLNWKNVFASSGFTLNCSSSVSTFTKGSRLNVTPIPAPWGPKKMPPGAGAGPRAVHKGLEVACTGGSWFSFTQYTLGSQTSKWLSNISPMFTSVRSSLLTLPDSAFAPSPQGRDDPAMLPMWFLTCSTPWVCHCYVLIGHSWGQEKGQQKESQAPQGRQSETPSSRWH